MNPMMSRQSRIELAQALAERERRASRSKMEGSLIEFYKAAWPAIDPAPYQHNWHLDAIAEHLEAVARGQIKKLLVNLPPRHSKTLLCSVAFNAWAWCQEPDEDVPLVGPGGRFMCLSYSDQLAMDNAVLTRRLIESDWYQGLWGKRVKITDDQDAKNKFDTANGGTRISGSFRGTVTGRGAGIRVYDDPHKMDEVESQVTRESVLRVYETTLQSRVTDPRISAEVLIAQRGHQKDLSSLFLDDPTTVHLNMPAEYDPGRHCVTVLGWEDPRTEPGQRLWPERWGDAQLAPYKAKPYEWASQWQQAPIPRGGGLIKEDWWQTYPVPANGLYDFVPIFTVASLDTAFKEKQENDYSALTVWSLYEAPVTKHRRIMLMDAWKKRLPLHGVRVEREQGEDDRSYLRRVSPTWGLCEWVNFTCTKRRVDVLLIEDSARGTDVNNEIKRIYHDKPWGTQLIPARGDKWSRGHAVVSMFTDAMIYAPGQWKNDTWEWRSWAGDAIGDICAFPHGTHDDIFDSAVQALRYLRDNNLAIRREERDVIAAEMATFKRQSASVAEHYFG